MSTQTKVIKHDFSHQEKIQREIDEFKRRFGGSALAQELAGLAIDNTLKLHDSLQESDNQISQLNSALQQCCAMIEIQGKTIQQMAQQFQDFNMAIQNFVKAQQLLSTQ